MADWVGSDRSLYDAPTDAVVVAAAPAGSNVSSRKEIVRTGQHSENDTDRNCHLQVDELQRGCGLSSCTLTVLSPFERPVGVIVTSAVFVFSLMNTVSMC